MVEPATSIYFEVWGSWIRSEKFSISSESFRFSKRIPIFQAKISDAHFFSQQLKNVSFITETSIYTHILAKFFLFFLDNNHFPTTYFQSKIRYSIFPDPSTAPLQLQGPSQHKMWGIATPQLPQD